jgi:hypothetical protein
MASTSSSDFLKSCNLKFISESFTSTGQIAADRFCKVGLVLIAASKHCLAI